VQECDGLAQTDGDEEGELRGFETVPAKCRAYKGVTARADFRAFEPEAVCGDIPQSGFVLLIPFLQP